MRQPCSKATLNHVVSAVAAVALISLRALSAQADILSITTASTLSQNDVSGAAGATVVDTVTSSEAKTFSARFGLTLFHNGLGALGHPIDEVSATFTSAFTVQSTGNYDMTVTVHRVGELRRTHLFINPDVVNCSVELSPMRRPDLTLSAGDGPILGDIIFPGDLIIPGSDNLTKELAEGERSQTIALRNRPGSENVSLVFEMAANAFNDPIGCEVSARVGAQSSINPDLCPTCGYPGAGNRDIDGDGLFVTVSIEDLCGNGTLDAGEQCDLGERTGAGSCCSSTCQVRPQNEVCRPAAGDCDAPEACRGDSSECPFDEKKPASTVCRAAAADGCDVAENCSGADDNCPSDTKRGDGFLCRPADPAAHGCDFAEVCDGGVCQPDAKATPGIVCDDLLFCNGDDACNAAGLCGLHLNAPCSGTQTCNEFGDACLDRPALVVTNDSNAEAGSLRAAIGAANLAGGADTITFDPGFFSVPRRITLANALPPINDDVQIFGPGANLLSVDGADIERVFTVNSGVNEISDLTITGGNAGAGAGGGILNSAALTIKRSHITGNTAAFGGGISNALGASLNVDKSTISNNTATGNSTGGGLASTSDVTITNSTISGNRATGSGGDNGGGLRLGSATIENSTITNNFAVGPNRAGGLRINVGTVTLRNSIIAANTASTPDVSTTSGSLSSEGFNLIGNPGPLNVNGLNDQKGTPAAPLDPLLGPLADNGGGTPTHALKVTSSALDRGSRFGAIADQRGRTRPFNVASIVGPGDESDIGAVELQASIVTNANDSGAGSLRQVIANAPANADILFDQTFFGVPRTIALLSEIPIAMNVAINGPGANLLTLWGRGQNRVFRVLAGGIHVAISGVTLSDGRAADGGAIISESDLSMSRCAIVGSHATSGSGGAVHMSNSVATFADCTFSENTSGVRGGAVELLASSASFTNCTISGNTANGFAAGGGISLFDTADDQMLAVINSTIVNNSGADAGGIRLEASAGLNATLTLRNSIIAYNIGASLHRAAVGNPATITSLGYNLTSDAGGGFLTEATDQIDTDPVLGPLQYNGGPTQTHMPLVSGPTGSPAIDKGNSAAIVTDQRGRLRSFDVPFATTADGGDQSDIGAVEAHVMLVTNDQNDAVEGSLRKAVADAPASSDILFDPIFFAEPRTIVLNSEIVINKTLTIHGTNPRELHLSGNDANRVFNVNTEKLEVAISGLTMRNGKPGLAAGGAIDSVSELALSACAVTDSLGAITGGGVSLRAAVGRFTNCTFTGNRVVGPFGRGGAVGMLQAASATFNNCTVSGNTATEGEGFGGGIGMIANAGGPAQTLTITNSTITSNSGIGGAATVSGGVGVAFGVAMIVRNSIIADNIGGSLKALSGATMTSLGYNLLGNAGVSAGPQDQITNAVMLGPLQDNGGATQTHAPLPGSPAIDKGASSGSATDQRGLPRPIDDTAIANAAGGDGADIGALELSLPPPTPTPTHTSTPTRTSTVVTATPTRTPTSTATTAGGNPTATHTRTATSGSGNPTPTFTRTPTAGTGTPTATRTITPTPGTGTPTATRTVTSTSGSPTATGTITPTAGIGTPTATRTITPTAGVGIPTATRTTTPTTGTGSPTPTATPTGGPPLCIGDCNRDRAVRVEELVVGVGIALDRRPIGDCLALDRDGNGAADVAELVAAVNNALRSCPVSEL